MALKGVLDNLDGLEASLAEHYKVHSDGKFYLETDKGDIGALLRAKEHEKNLRVSAEAKVVEKDEALTALTTERDTVASERDDARRKKGGDTEALEQSYKDKIAKLEGDRATEVGSLTGEINRLLVSERAMAIATEISTVPELVAPVIEARLATEKGTDGKFFLRVLDGDKKPSAGSLDDLKQELLANDKYAAIMVSGKGSGGGAGAPGSGGGATEKKAMLDFSDLELKTMRTAEPEKYQRLVSEANAATAPVTV